MDYLGTATLVPGHSLMFPQCRNTSGLLAGGKHITAIFVGSIFHMPIGTKKQCCTIRLRHPSSLAKEQGRICCTALVRPAVSRQAA